MKSWAIQVAVKTKLDAASALTALLNDGVNSIRDGVRQDDGFPYIAIYDVASQEEDTMAVNGLESLYSIHIWSRYKGQKEVRQIMDEVYNALHNQPLTISGSTHIMTLFKSSDTFTEEDGETRRGIANFRIVTE
ncbi:MAG: DUF3168 domain-containing protein [Deltaproteobacteria bacterium]|nr:DUF3168 domain-containing protein [Deltaproteobacteria bacterium]